MIGTTTTKLVERWVAALNDHDPDAYGALLADDYEEVGPSGSLHGREAGVADARELFRTQPDTALRVSTLLVRGDVAAVEYRMTGTLLAPFVTADGRAVPATGRRYDMDGCALVWTDGSHITAVHSYWDRALMREQLGLA